MEPTSYLEQELATLQSLLKEATQLLAEATDPDLKKLAQEEVSSLQEKIKGVQASVEEFHSLATHSDKDPKKQDSPVNPDLAILEVRAGAGGDEAGLFAAELYRMYTRLGQNKGWKISELSRHDGGIGNIKEVTAEIKGPGVYTLLQKETGTHRVQRVPTTESSGRVHTSTATVAVLPIVTAVSLEIKPEDIKFDFFRASGHGGQNVNKVETAVRATHLPTEITVECQEERSQAQNRERAVGLLRSRLYQMLTEQQKSKVDDLRAQQVGTAERSEKIRTYNFPQNRVTDHRLKQSWGQLERILDGEMEEIIEALKTVDEGSDNDKSGPEPQ